jgi:hypothetical protein
MEVALSKNNEESIEVINTAIDDIIKKINTLKEKKLVNIEDIIASTYTPDTNSFIQLFYAVCQIMDIPNELVIINDPTKCGNEIGVHIEIDYRNRNTNNRFDTAFYFSEFTNPITLVTQVIYELGDYIQYDITEAYTDFMKIIEIEDTNYYHEIIGIYYGFGLFYLSRNKERTHALSKFILDDELIIYVLAKWSVFHNYKYENNLFSQMLIDQRKKYIEAVKYIKITS